MGAYLVVLNNMSEIRFTVLVTCVDRFPSHRPVCACPSSGAPCATTSSCITSMFLEGEVFGKGPNCIPKPFDLIIATHETHGFIIASADFRQAPAAGPPAAGGGMMSRRMFENHLCG